MTNDLFSPEVIHLVVLDNENNRISDTKIIQLKNNGSKDGYFSKTTKVLSISGIVLCMLVSESLWTSQVNSSVETASAGRQLFRCLLFITISCAPCILLIKNLKK